ncbi:hypothetical protein NPIL_223761, partial [Nephila pilipes]
CNLPVDLGELGCSMVEHVLRLRTSITLYIVFVRFYYTSDIQITGYHAFLSESAIPGSELVIFFSPHQMSVPSEAKCPCISGCTLELISSL